MVEEIVQQINEIKTQAQKLDEWSWKGDDKG